MTAASEAQVLRDVREVFERAGWKVLRLHAGTSRGGAMHHAEAGAPDLVCLAPTRGRVVLVECKTEWGCLSAAQMEFSEWCLGNHDYRVVRSVEDAERVLREAR